MKNFKKGSAFTALSILLLLTSITAKASIFTLVGGDPGTLPGNWNPSNAPPASELMVNDSITIFDGAGEGIRLNGDADLVYTYIGKEAGSTNASSTSLDNRFFITGSTAANTTFETSGSAGWLDFSFEGLATCCRLNPGSFINGFGNIGENGGLSLAVAMIDSSSLYLMFGDGFGDADYDDMFIKVEAVSAVPGAIWLFGTALVGFIGLSRKRNGA